MRAKCPPRALKTITLKLVGPITLLQGFFILIVTGGGKLLAFLGLVDIHSDEEITLLVANPTAQTVTISDKAMLGKVYMVNKQDVADTELIELTKNPITETKFNFKKETPSPPKKPEQKHKTLNCNWQKTEPIYPKQLQKNNKLALRKVIRSSKLPWASPILLADKKNRKIRFCIDFRALNKVTKKDSYPLPKMDEILAVLGNVFYFSIIDLTDTFWSIPIHPDDIKKTAFTSKYGLWEFLSMPFRLCNTPPTQQQFIEAVLNGLLWICCFAYLDDILTFSTSFENLGWCPRV